jgi:type I restriction enzyme S subunit
MTIPEYNEYREGNFQWFERFPTHWESTRIKRVLRAMGSGGTPETSDDRFWSDAEGVPWVAIGDMSERDSVERTTKALTPTGVASKGLTVWPAGTLIFSMYASLGHVAVLKIDATINQAILALIPSERVNSSFLKRWLEYIKPRLRQEASSNTQDNLNAQKVRNLPLLLPPIEEQVKIVDFLDRETTKIDVLVAEQEGLIELLEEKRQAVISHAVTKGLDPKVQMMNSGVAWIGDMPAHWALQRIKSVAKLESGHTPSRQVPEYWENCNLPWVSLNDSKQLAKADHITETAVQISELGLANSSARMLPAGAVVFTRDATIGLAAITTRSMAVSQHLIAWIPGARVQALYLLRVFNVMKAFLDSTTFGATIKTIGMADVKKLVTPLPPVDEQARIAEYIDQKKSEFSEQIDAARAVIALLGERRVALISAAVTGQIDVRQLEVA